jgi:hypothetical protein
VRRADPGELFEALIWLDGFYASAEGLMRPQGLSINGQPDFEGIAAWIFDVFLNSRLNDLDIDTCKRNVVHAIQQTQEWKAKHGLATGTTAATPFASQASINRGEFLASLHRLHVFYKAWSGLQRPDGLSINGRPDFEGIAAWLFGSYLNNRLDDVAPEEAWDRVVEEIRHSVEWRVQTRRPVDARSLHGKHLAGYQGWFGTPADGQSYGWDHWFGGAPIASLANFDLWPDTRELFEGELAPTEMVLAHGGPAKLFSCHIPRTIRRHFDWMADAGIDGVSLGRFAAGTVDDQSRNRLDHLLVNLRAAAEVAGRVFFVWYDLTDCSPVSFVADVRRDWTHITLDLGMTRSPSYLHHHEKPIVGIWGAGAEGRPGSPAEWIELISALRNHPASAAMVLLGGTRGWRTDAIWDPVFAAADIVAPWSVAAYGDEAGADQYRREHIEKDLLVIAARGQEYLPILFPGFSWHNLKRGTVPINGAPRRGGRFYWRQVYNAVDAGVTNLFTAMFDEVDEGTAIFKIAEAQRDVPIHGTFLTLDADGETIPSDWYLRLAGAAGRVLRKEQPLTPQIPISP